MNVRVFGKLGAAVLATVAIFLGVAQASGTHAVSSEDVRAWRQAERASFSDYGPSRGSAFRAWRASEREAYSGGEADMDRTVLAWRRLEQSSYSAATFHVYLDWRRSERASISFVPPRLAEQKLD